MSPNVIIVSIIGATGLTVLKQIYLGEKTFQPVISGFIVGTVVLSIALVSPTIAGMLAMLLLLTSILVNAIPILKHVSA